MRTIAARLRADLAAGFGLLTRLPVGWLVPPGLPYRPGRAVWCYPLAGALLGLIAAVAMLLARASHLPVPLQAGWTLVLAVLLTGALHEDGLADLADGCGGGRTAERRLEIMRDSRIGAFGALALILCLGLRFAALESLATVPARTLLGWLAAIGALSRMAMLPVLLLPPARADGLGRSLGTLSRRVLVSALLMALLASVPGVGAGTAVMLSAAALLVGAVVSRFARDRLGGRTGDVLGATVMAAECVLLTVATVTV